MISSPLIAPYENREDYRLLFWREGKEASSRKSYCDEAGQSVGPVKVARHVILLQDSEFWKGNIPTHNIQVCAHALFHDSKPRNLYADRGVVLFCSPFFFAQTTPLIKMTPRCRSIGIWLKIKLSNSKGWGNKNWLHNRLDLYCKTRDLNFRIPEQPPCDGWDWSDSVSRMCILLCPMIPVDMVSAKAALARIPSSTFSPSPFRSRWQT